MHPTLRRICFVSLLGLSGLQAAVGEVREWISNDGRPLKGKLLEVTAEAIVVESAGKRLDIPVRFLSKADQDYVATLVDQQAMAKQMEADDAARLQGFKEGKYSDAVRDKWVKFDSTEHGLIYQLYIGKDATRKKAGPLVPLFLHLHGASGRADDVNPGKVEIAAQMLVKPEQYKETPCVVCVPLCPPEPQTWGKQTARLEAIVDDLVASLPIDRDRIYLSGYSQGAAGIASMISSRPTAYAAAIFADGSPRDSWYGKVRTDMWFYFSGERDSSMIEEAQTRFTDDKLELRFNILPEVKHNSIHWKIAKDPEVFEWLFEQRLEASE